jgi:hypothetical protein
MAARQDLLGRLAAGGVAALGPGEAMDALLGLPAGTPAVLGLARVDWPVLLARRGGGQPYTLLAELGPAPSSDPDEPRRLQALTELVLADPVQAHRAILAGLLDRVGVLLGLPAEDIAQLRPGFGQTRLNVLGLDSLSTIRLRARIHTDFAADVPPDVLFGGGTAAEIVELIGQQLVIRAVMADGGPTDPAETEVLTL